jgi:hypothetical protein
MKAIAIVEALKALAILFVAALFISTTATAGDTRVAELPAAATVAMVTPTKASVVVVKPAPKATRPPQGKRAVPAKGRNGRAADWQLENPQLG